MASKSSLQFKLINHAVRTWMKAYTNVSKHSIYKHISLRSVRLNVLSNMHELGSRKVSNLAMSSSLPNLQSNTTPSRQHLFNWDHMVTQKFKQKSYRIAWIPPLTLLFLLLALYSDRLQTNYSLITVSSIMSEPQIRRNWDIPLIPLQEVDSRLNQSDINALLKEWSVLYSGGIRSLFQWGRAAKGAAAWSNTRELRSSKTATGLRPGQGTEDRSPTSDKQGNTSSSSPSIRTGGSGGSQSTVGSSTSSSHGTSSTSSHGCGSGWGSGTDWDW
ncbi:hypothetical protein BDQ12DRAFT_680655 [Crucibulum laeve]|uniref:Uncharacterized protein n=1 Tax=Crucibulum laeve TaxID=68775 RepID=A0A5C3M4D1_9AGAR|nr:hypothetical protein BDQ12DRAFT_680655 [Crucibulum laeve]